MRKLNDSLLLILLQESVTLYSYPWLQTFLCIWITFFHYIQELFDVIKDFFHFFH